MVLTFDDLTIDLDGAEVRRNGTPVKVEPLILELLAYLTRHRGRLVSKDELFEQVWKGKIVSEAALTQAVAVLRRILGDDGRRAAIIQTVRGRGYRLQTPQPSVADDVPVVVGAPRPVPFVGRHELMRKLDAALEEAVDGRGRLFLLHGPRGSGKTRVCDEVAATALRRGVNVARTIAVDRPKTPYEPWVELLEGMRESGLFESLGGDDLVADMLWRLRREETDGSLRDGAEIGDAMVAALTACARRVPLLIILDDLHAAGIAGVELLRRVSRDLEGLPLLFLTTYRDAEPEQAGEPAGIIADLAGLTTAQSEVLGGLTKEETARLLQVLTGRPPRAQRVASLFRKTGGNPLALCGAARGDK